jgi:hypothetical protein
MEYMGYHSQALYPSMTMNKFYSLGLVCLVKNVNSLYHQALGLG